MLGRIGLEKWVEVRRKEGDFPLLKVQKTCLRCSEERFATEKGFEFKKARGFIAMNMGSTTTNMSYSDLVLTGVIKIRN